ncbi:hypothetical protein POSPLADRAFT_1050126 [Postia placenta MAD-698-R-SB12]|uniref:Uncharacterized protein n=1 Tax=Postia placenta MAD-698-R-SB12 TaxID=670580 RepID=A0A1X6MM60_9APHY|nr:hypothetical protein POSPLADRAFT_1050126 [Postia placenta MAD-698-R-SB12]OSX57494.1 hypothetical protein POSPLADRAFT_1050126 [Postia placenta MAD-698-R-SB12]
MVIQHDSLIQPAADNVDRDWYNLYTAVDHVKKLKSSEDTEIKRGTSGIEELRDEHDCYVKLRDLQGQEIPKCYGLFQSSGDAYSRDRASRRSTWACLVLAYCGERPPNGDLMCMPWEFKLGVIHRDVCKPGNVIDFNGKPTEAIPFDIIEPMDRFCREIAEAAKETWLWRASFFETKFGTQIPADLLEDEEMTPEEIIHEIVTGYIPRIMDSPIPIDLEAMARAEVKRYHKLMETRNKYMRPSGNL